jgi:hypothetical protein
VNATSVRRYLPFSIAILLLAALVIAGFAAGYRAGYGAAANAPAHAAGARP